MEKYICTYVSGIQVRGPLFGSKLVSRARLVACRSSDSLFQLLDTPKFSWGSSLETVVPDARQTRRLVERSRTLRELRGLIRGLDEEQFFHPREVIRRADPCVSDCGGASVGSGSPSSFSYGPVVREGSVCDCPQVQQRGPRTRGFGSKSFFSGSTSRAFFSPPFLFFACSPRLVSCVGVGSRCKSRAPRWVVEREVMVCPSFEAAYDSDVAVSRHEYG